MKNFPIYFRVKLIEELIGGQKNVKIESRYKRVNNYKTYKYE